MAEQAVPRPHSYAPLSISSVADEAILKKVWKREIRTALRSLKFDGFNLVPDPIHYAAYEWGLDTLVTGLSRDLKLGRYSPERGEIVRTAKGNGLSRPLIFLAARDALVYRAITFLVEGQLVANSPIWVGFAHGDKGHASHNKLSDDAGDASINWFEIWLSRQGRIRTMMENPTVAFFVESDIANFYPSIRLEAVREHLHSNTTLDKEVVRLCVQIIDGVMPRQDYSEVSLMGLPQETVGSSRSVAHSLLRHVDEAFTMEGAVGRYARYMDDIVIGVEDTDEGEHCISRLQLRLEALGLYPNASKTRIVSVEQYLQDTMADTNAEIERLTKALEDCDSGRVPHISQPSTELIEEIAQLSKEHRTIVNPSRRWGRVMRRLYTLQRRAGMIDWWQYWRDDVETEPGSAGSIFEYVRCYPLTRQTVEDLVALSRKYCHLYADVSILAAETIATAPNSNDTVLQAEIFRLAHAEFNRLLDLNQSSPEIERIAAAWLVSAWKFGNDAQCQAILADIPAGSDSMSPVRAQALPLLASSGQSLSEWVAAKPGLAWEDALAAEYLRSLAEGDDKAIGVALSLVTPQPRLLPQRFTMLPRALPLMEMLGRHAKASRKFNAVAPRHLRSMRKNPHRLRDHRAESMISRWCL